MDGIDHLDLVVSDLDRSLAFYRGLLEPLGYTSQSEIVGERGERVVYLGRSTIAGAVSLRERRQHDRATPYERYDLGIHHIAFVAPSRATVDDRAEWARANGGTIDSGPKEYDYTPGYYAVFLLDPDGIKLELVHRPAERELVERIEALEGR